MILMKEYVSLTIVPMKVGKRHFHSDHSNGCSEEKNALLSNSMSNNPGHVTLISSIFSKKVLPVLGVLEIGKS